MQRNKDFIDTKDFSTEEIMKIVKLSIALKKCIKNDYYPKLLQDKTLGMIFEQNSTRTRVAFETAMTQLGGHAEFLSPSQLQVGAIESVEDTAVVLSRMVDILMARVGNHSILTKFAEHATVPVLNGMSNYNHPTQEIGDLITILENLPEGKEISDCKIVFVGDATQVCASLGFITTRFGMNFVHYGPNGYHLNKTYKKIMTENCEVSGGSFLTTDKDDCLKDADFIYGDVWHGLAGNKRTNEESYKIFYPKYQITDDLIKKTGKDTKFMHCLPAKRNTDVVTTVLDAPYSIVFEQAENRLNAMRGILVYLFRNKEIDEKELEEAKTMLDEVLKEL